MPEATLRNTTVPQSVLEGQVVAAVAKALDLKPEKVTLSSSLQDDLGAESLDYLDIAFQLERNFNVQFPRADLLQRASDHFGEDALVKDGVVTDLGLSLLRKGMPEVDPGRFRPGLRAIEVASMFTVWTFVRVLDRLLAAKEQMPRQCPKCGSELAESPNLPEFVCSGCGEVVPLPSGDAILFQDLLELND
jgi:acyl carrier protein